MAGQAQREKVNLCGEFEVRNRLFQESRAKKCRDIEELQRICCEETDRARPLRLDDCTCNKRGSYFCESPLDSNSGFTEQDEFLV